jgi:outer membrane protein assembly factor BamA
VWSDLVEDIEIRGYRTAPIEEIKKRIKTQPGDEYKQEQAQQDFQSILDMKAFDALKSKLVVEPGPRGGVIVIFDLKETSK